MDHLDVKKFCRVCNQRVNKFYKKAGGRRCVVCLHRTHGKHLAKDHRVCLKCADEEVYKVVEGQQRPSRIKILHLTDLHFGEKYTSNWCKLIYSWLKQNKHHYILISGDITARSKESEYQAASFWLKKFDSLNLKTAVVPGNHDIGYWGDAKSLFSQTIGRKYHQWLKWIDRPLEPCVRGNHCIILGLNSAHGINPSRLFNGYIDHYQRTRAKRILELTPRDYLKVVFCHHPMVKFEGTAHRAMFNAEKTRDELMQAGAHLFMWGHQHCYESVQMFGDRGNCLVLQSPTLSKRTRGESLPGFATVEWVFDSMAIIKIFEIINKEIREKEIIEYLI